MTTAQRVKRKIIIVLGLSLSAYLMYSGFSILSIEEKSDKEVIKSIKVS